MNYSKIAVTVTGNMSRHAESYLTMFGSKPAEAIKRLEILASAMYQHGFLLSEGHVGIGPANKEDKRECELNRAGFLDDLKGTTLILQTGDSKEKEVKVTPEMLAAFAKKTWIPELEFTTYYGHCRQIAILVANVARQAKGLSLIEDIPVDDLGELSDEQRLILCVQENTQKGVGVVPLTDIDKLVASRMLYQLGKPEIEFRRLFKAGTGQKLFAIMEADRMFPDVKLVDGLVSGDQYSWANLTSENLRKLTKAVKNAPAGELKDDAITKLKAYLSKPKEEGEPRIIVRNATIKGLIDQCPVKIIQDTCKALAANDVSFLAQYVIRATEINSAIGNVIHAAKIAAKGKK